MNIYTVFKKAFSTQLKEYEHHLHDYILLLGTLSGIMCITLGLSMFLFLRVMPVSPVYSALGVLWAFFGTVTLAGVFLFRAGKKRSSAAVFILSGVSGMFLGAGFLLGAGLSVFTGMLVIKDILDNRKRRK